MRKKEEEIFRRIARLIPDGLFVIDIEGKVIFWNKILESMTGIAEEEIVGKDNFEYSIPFYGFRRPMPVDYILNSEMQYPGHINKKNGCVEIETFLPKLYGEKGAWVRLTDVPLVNEACDLIGGIQIVRDISERKLAESTLKKLRLVIEHSPIGVIITTFSGEIIYCNQAFLNYTGFETAESLNIYEIFPMISLYEIHNGHLKEIRYNGKIFRLRGLRLEDEELYGYAIFITNITELKKLEEQIIISQKMEIIQRLTSTYTHDLKNILTGIKGFAHLAMQRENLDMAKSDIDKLLKVVNSTLENIKKMLDFGKNVVRNPEMIDLRDGIKKIVPLLKATLRENIKLNITLGNKPLVIFADKSDIEKIVLNLVLNSQDAMCNGGEIKIIVSKKSLPEKYVALQQKDIEKDYACLTIVDTGIGMDEETKKRIFEPFFTTKGEKGSGFGLPTVYYIVQILNGHIFVDSEVGKGTTFDIYIPLKL